MPRPLGGFPSDEMVLIGVLVAGFQRRFRVLALDACDGDLQPRPVQFAEFFGEFVVQAALERREARVLKPRLLEAGTQP